MLKTLIALYSFVASKRAVFALFVIAVVGASLARSVLPYFYKLLVDALPSGEVNGILTIIFIFISVRVIGMLISATSYYLGDKIIFDATRDARIEVFNKIQDLDFAYHTKKSTGSMISVIKRGDGAFFTLFNVIHQRILDTSVNFVVMAIFFSQLSVFITVSVAISFFVNLVITKFLVGLNIRTRADFNEQEDKISGIIVDNIINYDTVKLFAKESWETDRLTEAFVSWRRAFWKYGNSFRVLDLSVGSLINISVLIILLLTLNSFSAGAITLGDFALVLGFVSSFFPQLSDLVYGFRDIAKNYADIEKYFAILDEPIKIKDPQVPVTVSKVKGEIDFNKVTFTYGERKNRALKDFSLKVRQGQSIALVGKSGSGKTTFAKLLMRFYDVDKGEITIDGINIKNFTKSKLRSFMGVVPQEPILFNNTLSYNIAYGKTGATQKEIEAASQIAGIHGFIDSLPKKYQTEVGERGIKLSGGQKQRVAIARMILSDPEIIIFDEATSHLDSESERLIQEGFWKAAEGKTTIIIAHRLSTVMRADKIVVMDKGKIVEVGKHMDLVSKKKSLYKRFWDLQIKLDK